MTTKAAPPVGSVKFDVDRDDLFAAIVGIASVMPSRASLPVLSQVRIEASGGRLRLTGTNLDEWLTLEVAADIAGEGSFCVDAVLLHDLLERFPEGPVRIGTHATDVVVRTGDIGATLVLTKADEFPEEREVEETAAATIDGPALRLVVRSICPAVFTEESGPILSGVLLQFRPGRVTAVGADGHMLARLRMPAGDGVPTGDIIVAPRAIALIEKHCGRADSPVDLRWNETTLIASIPGARVRSRLIEGPYPDYEVVLREPDEVIHAIASVEAVRAALGRANVIAGDSNHRIRLRLEDDGIMVSASHVEFGEIREPVSACTSGRPFAISVNVRLLDRALRGLTADRARLGFLESERAVTITDVPATDFIQVVMPLRDLD